MSAGPNSLINFLASSVNFAMLIPPVLYNWIVVEAGQKGKALPIWFCLYLVALTVFARSVATKQSQAAVIMGYEIASPSARNDIIN